MTVVGLRKWRGVKPVAGPSGTAITTRLRMTGADKSVLDAVAMHLGRLRRADLATVSRPESLGTELDSAGRQQARRNELNSRKRELTALSSSRWAHSVISANDRQYRSSRDAQHRHIADLRAAVAAIENRLSRPTSDMLTDEEAAGRKKQRLLTGYPTQAERFQKQRRLQTLRAELARVIADRDAGRVRVTEGGKRLAKTRHNLQAAGLSPTEWREAWQAARWRLEAIGTGTEPFGNLTITVTPDGEVSIRLPTPLEHMANAKHGRYVLSGSARFVYRRGEWLARITGGKPVTYRITRKSGQVRGYLTATWTSEPETHATPPETPGTETRAAGPVVGVDLNDGHLAVRGLDPHGNPIGRPERIEFTLTGAAARRDAQVRHAITRLIRYTKRHRINAIAVEDLNFADARSTGRETMAEAAAASGSARPSPESPPGVTRARPEDHAVRATNQAGPNNPRASTSSRHRPGTRGSESRPPSRARTQPLDRAIVTPAHQTPQ
jgi:hypothetical protein